MKRITMFFVLVIALFAVTPVMAQVPRAKIVTLEGKTIIGDYLTKTDSTVVLADWGKKVQVPINDIEKMLLQGETFIVRDGVLVKREKPTAANVNPSDPNYVIAKALQTTGGTAMGIGIPSLLVGVVCLGVAYSDGYPTTDMGKAKAALAGSILLPIGASLTIIGIPLTVHGKRVMDVSLNYKGNAAAIAFNF